MLVVRSFDSQLIPKKLDTGLFWEHALVQNHVKNVDFYSFDDKLSMKLMYINKLMYYYTRRTLFDVFKKAERDFLDYLDGKTYDMILFIKGELVRKELLRKIRNKHKTTALINVFPDNPLFYFYTFQAIPEYDHFFLKDSYVLNELKKVGYSNCSYLPQACSDRFHQRINPKILSSEERKKFSSDISFIGSIYPQRQRVLETLKNHNLKIWGKTIWQEVDKDSWILGYHQNELAAFEKKCKVISCSKINLNTHHFQNDIFGCNKRLFEICGCGGFQIVDYKNDLDKLFKVGKEVEVFSSSKELNEKIAYYLREPEERKKIASAGYKRAHRDHTYAQRIKKILEIIKA